MSSKYLLKIFILEVGALGFMIDNENLLEFYIYETTEQLMQLENIALHSEAENSLENRINEVFRLVHTMKGSSAVMDYKNIVELSHSLEDVFYFIRENNPKQVDYTLLTEIVLKSIDFIKKEISTIQSTGRAEGNVSELVAALKGFLEVLSVKKPLDKNTLDPGKEPVPAACYIQQPAGQQQYKAVIFFEDGCEMENVRAFNIIYHLEKSATIINYLPYDILQSQATEEYIRNHGFEINFTTGLNDMEVEKIISETLFIKEIRLEHIEPQTGEAGLPGQTAEKSDHNAGNAKQSMISVSIAKMDRLMDLVGELVISQAMVVQNPELEGLKLSGFHKASRQLELVTGDIQEAVMSLRMISLSMTFQKMKRIVRDMGKKLKKEIHLELIGEDTEVDKNIMEHLSDPLLHLVRNAADHGIEDGETRIKTGKQTYGTVTLEAGNDGGDVRIVVKDDGRGLDRQGILQKAKQQGLLHKPEQEYTDREIFSMIFLPGFSTKEAVTEFSGRGVGMDVVNKNIEEIGGTIQVESAAGKFTSVMIKIPLTLAIIEGMKIRVGKEIYIVPITSIRESFRFSGHSLLYDEISGREMIMLRGNCYPVLRLHRHFKLSAEASGLEEGIFVVVEYEAKTICLFADELIGVQQVVIKALPPYIKKRKDISSCTVLGDGNVCLIIDVPGLFYTFGLVA
jgi:two-component system chemotaxis sensor kinase CheA